MLSILLTLMLLASGLPALSVVLFILGAGIWILGFLLGRFRPQPENVWAGFGVDIGTLLMIAAIGVKTIFGA